MLLSALKNCTLRLPMCQLVTHNIRNANIMKMKGSHHYWRELKYLYLKNPNFMVYKHLCTNPASQEMKDPIPRLMSFSTANFSLLSIYLFYWPIRLGIDVDFKISEFLTGAKQAIKVISNELATQNYESLVNVVPRKTLKLLKCRVDRLTEQQRKLLVIDVDKNKHRTTFFHICKVNTRNTKDGTQTVLDITVAGCQVRNDFNEIQNPFTSEIMKSYDKILLTYVYGFQKKYIDNIGGPWMVKLVSYGTLSSYLHPPFW